MNTVTIEQRTQLVDLSAGLVGDAAATDWARGVMAVAWGNERYVGILHNVRGFVSTSAVLVAPMSDTDAVRGIRSLVQEAYDRVAGEGPYHRWLCAQEIVEHLASTPAAHRASSARF